MSGTSNGHPAQTTFTIEQIELIRRLRNSGLTKEQVVQAFESFERVDTELGDLYTVPVSLSQQKSVTAACSCKSQSQASNHHSQQTPNTTSHQHSQQHTTAAVKHTSGTAPYPQIPAKPSSTVSYSHTQQHTATPSSHHGQNGYHHSNSSSPPSTTAATTTNQSSSGHVNRRFQAAKRHKPDKSEDEEGSGSKEVVVRMSIQDIFPETVKAVSLFTADGTGKDVEEFLKKGAEDMHADIRDFLFCHPLITSNEIAAATGLSVTCVSKFLVGNFTALPSLTLRKLSQWFVTSQAQQQSGQQQRQAQHQQCNSQTSKLLQDIIQERLNSGTCAAGNGHSPMDMGVEKMDVKPGDFLFGQTGAGGVSDKDGSANYSPRRERFTFRKKHLEILEECFNANQYPTFEERIDIAQRCNDVMELASGRGLGEKEKMTFQNVAYWFSNRRKDVKRMAREGKLETSEVVLPSRVRQSPPLPTMEGGDRASPLWTAETSNGSYSSLDMPNVGPIAFPTTTTTQHSLSETAAGSVNTNSNSVTTNTSGNCVTADGSGSADVGGCNSIVSIKVEPQDPDSPSTSVRNGRGSAVDRIAAEISSNWMAKTAVSSASATEGQKAESMDENQDSVSLQENGVKAEKESESH